jgi:hypothetical protein
MILLRCGVFPLAVVVYGCIGMAAAFFVGQLGGVLQVR